MAAVAHVGVLHELWMMAALSAQDVQGRTPFTPQNSMPWWTLLQKENPADHTLGSCPWLPAW